MSSIAIIACSLLAAWAIPASSASRSHGTLAQVERQVAASVHITTLSPAVAAELPAAPTDFSWSNYPAVGTSTGSTCHTVTACVYGDLTSSKVVVLFGDSHALMWLNALAPWAASDKVKLVLLWQGLCPPGDLSVYAPGFADPPLCNAYRAQMIAAIQKLAPTLVVLAEKTTQVKSAASAYFTDAQWEAGLVTTITELQTPATKVAVLEDTPTFASSVPECLAAHPTAVQSCAVRYVAPKIPGHESAELAAARKTGATYVRTQGWFCTALCSPVIGPYIPYIDTNHVSFSYAGYLSGVMGAALKPLI